MAASGSSTDDASGTASSCSSSSTNKRASGSSPLLSGPFAAISTPVTESDHGSQDQKNMQRDAFRASYNTMGLLAIVHLSKNIMNAARLGSCALKAK